MTFDLDLQVARPLSMKKDGIQTRKRKAKGDGKKRGSKSQKTEDNGKTHFKTSFDLLGHYRDVIEHINITYFFEKVKIL